MRPGHGDLPHRVVPGRGEDLDVGEAQEEEGEEVQEEQVQQGDHPHVGGGRRGGGGGARGPGVVT